MDSAKARLFLDDQPTEDNRGTRRAFLTPQLEPELRKKDLAIQHDFDIVPVVYPGRAA